MKRKKTFTKERKTEAKQNTKIVRHTRQTNQPLVINSSFEVINKTNQSINQLVKLVS
jgi:hypothetical protein